MYDSLIVGGGAAGLFAAVVLARGGARVIVAEKGPRVGKRLLATGNGTCNITNIAAAPAHYHGAQRNFVAPALAAFPPAAAMEAFRSIGVLCKARADGRVYPLCEQAAAVLDCLRGEGAALGVEERCDTAVTALRRVRGGFEAATSGGPIAARTVLVAAGGAASPSLGGCTDGYALLASLGHKKTPLFPSITQIKADSPFLKAVKGLRADATLTLSLDGWPVQSAFGELLFCDYGLSGPVALALSRPVGDWERRQVGRMTVSVDLLPDWEPKDVEVEIRRRRTLPGRRLEELLTGLVNKRIGQTVLRAAGALSFDRPVDTLTDQEAAAIAATLKGWTFPVTGTKGFAAAQVTAGGIATADFDSRTMESRLVPGLYAAGEVLDVDGDCGGYNLQWAWSSAHAAATAILQRRGRP